MEAVAIETSSVYNLLSVFHYDGQFLSPTGGVLKAPHLSVYPARNANSFVSFWSTNNQAELADSL